MADRQKSLEKSQLLPDIRLGYFNQSLNGPGQTRAGDPIVYSSGDRFTGFQVGLAIPLFGANAQVSEVKAAELKKQQTNLQLEAMTNELNGQLSALIQQHQKSLSSLSYYQENALPQAELILEQSQKGFASGEISYMEYVQGLDRALSIKFNYLDILNQYNQTLIRISYISGIL